MKIHKIISKSKNGKQMEVIAIDDKGKKQTFHIHKKTTSWQYCVDKDKEKRLILKTIDLERT